jgi:hypothetical protein
MSDPNDDPKRARSKAGSLSESSPPRGGAVPTRAAGTEHHQGGAAFAGRPEARAQARAPSSADDAALIELPEKLPVTKLQPVRLDPGMVVDWAARHAAPEAGGEGQGVDPHHAAAPEATASPWASSGGGGAIQQEALPSAHAPRAAAGSEIHGLAARDREIARLRKALALSLGVTLVALGVSIATLLLRWNEGVETAPVAASAAPREPAPVPTRVEQPAPPAPTEAPQAPSATASSVASLPNQSPPSGSPPQTAPSTQPSPPVANFPPKPQSTNAKGAPIATAPTTAQPLPKPPAQPKPKPPEAEPDF